MAAKSPKTISEYISAAPSKAKPHLSELYAILKEVAPDAMETIKWSSPFFVEPRFLFSFSAHKAHLGFASSNDALDPYRDDLKEFEITNMGILKIPYSKNLPRSLIKKIAKRRLKLVETRMDDNFW
ncbi:MAG: DUF1801 domain-containing protein [Gammaproteobacteria bacterium]